MSAQVSFIAAGPVKLLSLSRGDLEAKIGKLADIIEADSKKEVSLVKSIMCYTTCYA
jgi:alpha-D-ribose 1-methylphosphonate 5-triphosphate diphosphatase PhnM